MSLGGQRSKKPDPNLLVNDPTAGSNGIEEDLLLHDPQIVRTFFDGLTRIVVAISTLGAGFTFSFILSDVNPPSIISPFNAVQVRFFLAMSWFLFDCRAYSFQSRYITAQFLGR